MLNKGAYLLIGLLILNPAIILAYQSFTGPVHIDTSEYSIQKRHAPSRSIASLPQKPEPPKEDSSCKTDSAKECKEE